MGGNPCREQFNIMCIPYFVVVVVVVHSITPRKTYIRPPYIFTLTDLYLARIESKKSVGICFVCITKKNLFFYLIFFKWIDVDT